MVTNGVFFISMEIIQLGDKGFIFLPTEALQNHGIVFQYTTQKSTLELYQTSLKYFEKIFEQRNLLVITHSFDV